ncbi:MAG: NAD(P)/FAD-dependent oxidoreductase [Rhizobacter sp.]|nr:NAD(P)/FAD-dependent oxidoreductase [Bacteriovorax sp.]
MLRLNQKLKIGIIGAGPAGSMIAYRLAKAGHEVHILERKSSVERKVCGEYLCPKGVELLQDLNLLEKLCHKFSPLFGMVLVSPMGEIIPSYFPQTLREEKGLSLHRKIFDENLLQLALDSGAVLHYKTVTNAFQKTDETWSVVASEEIFEFNFLIAADGRQSKIGNHLGHVDNIYTTRIALHCFLPRKISRGQRLGEMHILPHGAYCGLDPVSDDEVNFSIVCDSLRLKTERPKDIINQEIKNSKRLSEMFDPVTDETDIKIVSSLKNKNHFIAGDNLAYVGDAAGFIDPLTGEGIYNAIQSSTILADCLENYPDVPQALAAYKKRKKQLSFQKNILNHFFQFLIRRSFLIKLTVKFLKKSPERASNFIGIIGNIHDPVTGFIKMLKA